VFRDAAAFLATHCEDNAVSAIKDPVSTISFPIKPDAVTYGPESLRMIPAVVMYAGTCSFLCAFPVFASVSRNSVTQVSIYRIKRLYSRKSWLFFVPIGETTQSSSRFLLIR
jgi:hypothetical protein